MNDTHNTSQLGVPVGLVRVSATVIRAHLATIEHSIDKTKVLAAIAGLADLADTLTEFADLYAPVVRRP